MTSLINRMIFLSPIVLAWLVIAPGGTSAEAQPQRPNILLLVCDDLRPDVIAALGNKTIDTPHLDTLVREGIAFTRAVCANPICVCSRAEILTGCSGFRNGVLGIENKPIDPSLKTWAQSMRDAGYHTWYTGKWHNDGKPTTRGYEETRGLFVGGGPAVKDAVDWKGRPVTGYTGWVFQSDDGRKSPELGVGLTPDISSRFADAAIEFLGRKSERPFFLHVNFTAPHDPLLLPPGYANKYQPADMPLPANFLPEHPFDHGNLRGRDEQLWPWPRTPDMIREELTCYYAVISHLDRQIGRILAALDKAGRSSDTVVIFTSDHGLAIGSHGLRGKQNMYEHTINVPLVIRGPRIPRNERRTAQVYLRDLYPTVCELAGIPIPATVEGRSFVSLLSDPDKAIHPYIFGYFRDSQRMIRGERWKLIDYPQAGKTQLFDLQHDPDEIHDLSADPRRNAVLDDLRHRLKAWQLDVKDPLLKS